jgi:hypothetical protein
MSSPTDRNEGRSSAFALNASNPDSGLLTRIRYRLARNPKGICRRGHIDRDPINYCPRCGAPFVRRTP